MALTYTPQDTLGKPMPDFNLLGMDGKTYLSQDFKSGKPVLVMFICNHCPYVKAIEDRLIQLGSDLKHLGIPVVAICSNDPNAYPEDSFENLKTRFLEKKYSFVYLHDPSQVVAKSFGAVCTPDFFLYDASYKLRYRGRLDDSWKDEKSVTKRELFLAAKDLLAGENIQNPEVSSMGCSIKWLK